jgi:hypothetical protein
MGSKDAERARKDLKDRQFLAQSLVTLSAAGAMSKANRPAKSKDSASARSGNKAPRHLNQTLNLQIPHHAGLAHLSSKSS